MASEASGISAAVGSAPGKLILFGEHAVVHHRLAIASCLSDLRMFVRVSPVDEATVSVTCPDLSGGDGTFTATWAIRELQAATAECGDLDPASPTPASDAVLAALRTLVSGSSCASLDPINSVALIPLLFLIMGIAGRHLMRDGAGGIAVRVQPVDLPPGSGLGSSAALCVATSAALVAATQQHSQDSGMAAPSEEGDDRWGCASEAHGWRPTPALLTLVNDWAFVGEKVIHGTPSGLDNTVSCYGGALTYAKEPKIQEPIGHFPPIRVLITNTRVPKSTGALVAGVRKRLGRLPTVVDPIMTAIDNISRECQSTVARMALPVEDENHLTHATALDRFAELIDINQQLLNALGVGHPALDNVVADSAAHGFHCKLTGAGGGGCAMTLLADAALTAETPAAGAGGAGSGSGSGSGSDAHARVDALVKKLEGRGFQCFETKIGGAGVLCHSLDNPAVKAIFGEA